MLARDTFGTVPLFYHRGKACVWFGTNPAALLAMGGLPRDLDPEGLGEHLISRSADPEVTIYAALRRVRRAAVTTFLPGEIRTKVYWTPGAAPRLRLKDDAAYVDAARAVLAQVLEGHLERPEPIGVMLSGGFDSGAIAATLAMLAPQREFSASPRFRLRAHRPCGTARAGNGSMCNGLPACTRTCASTLWRKRR